MQGREPTFFGLSKKFETLLLLAFFNRVCLGHMAVPATTLAHTRLSVAQRYRKAAAALTPPGTVHSEARATGTVGQPWRACLASVDKNSQGWAKH